MSMPERHAGGGDDLAVDDDALVGRIAPKRAQLVERQPVGRGPLALEEAGGAEQRASRCTPTSSTWSSRGRSSARRGLPRPSPPAPGPARRARAGCRAAGRRRAWRRPRGRGRWCRCAWDRLCGDEGEVGIGQPGKHLVGADGVESGEAVEQQDGDVHGGLASSRVGQAARKRRRYSVGLVRTWRRKVRRMVSAVPNPRGRRDGFDAVVGVLEQATGRLDPHALDVPRRRHADLRREGAGEAPLAHQRRSAQRRDRAVRTRVFGDVVLRRADSVVRGRLGLASGALNWLWLAGRRRNSTNRRAMASATSRPWSSSTRARARSMPAVTPAEVHTLPSRT